MTDYLMPFRPACMLLLDIAEANRLSSENYRAALARAPNLRRWRSENAPPLPPAWEAIVRTPWWGWVVIGSIVYALAIIAITR